ncbi:site-specific integrase [Rhizobium brockwellii]|uniref:Site-specific integrase n=1 Tax=Rhizobium brockwellii TaxID=3019932 RepID=A0ABU3YVI9_9HYPH|nr:site-specific integrase [Rhizobium brockwellii]MDV4182950.1 site-specific integrase [Rhizobium brockwellii]MDV4189854.1 site-specific integrase [Rhizobium brockwellii]
MAKPLTVKSVEAMKPGSSRREIADGGLPGLYLVVQPSGSMSWAIRYRFGGRPRKMTVGNYPLFGLAKAREQAGAALRSVAEGKDPGAMKLSEAAARSNPSNLVVAQLDQFLTKYVKQRNRESTARETERFVNLYLRKRWQHKLLADITRREIIDLLDEIAESHPISANRVHAILRRFFNWCIERDIIAVSPVANVTAPGEVVSRDRTLSRDEIRLVWLASEKIGWPFGPMVKLLLLTGQRRDEVASAQRPEFDLGANVPAWTIPKERAKNGKAHVVPLAPAAVEIIESLPPIDGEINFVLTTTGKTGISGFSRSKALLDAAMMEIAKEEAEARGEKDFEPQIAPWRLHDLRRTCASGMAELGQPVHVVEAVLNHKSGSIKGVAAVYNRYEYAEEKRRALFAWAAHVASLIDAPADNVVSLFEGKAR